MRAKPLHLPVAAKPGASAGVDDVGDALGDQRVAVLFGQEPLRAAADHGVEQLPRNPLAQLRILGRVLVLEPVVLGPRRAVGHEDRRRVERLGSRDERRHVLVERRDREAVLLAGVAVGHLRQVQLEIERALDGRGDAVFLARLDDPLTDDAIAGDVLLERVGAIRLLVALDEAEGGVAILDAGGREHAGPGRVDARPGNHPGVHHVGIREHVRASTSADRASSSRRTRGWPCTARPRSDAGRAAPTCASARRPGPA